MAFLLSGSAPDGGFSAPSKILALGRVVRPVNLLAIAIAASVGARLGSRESDVATVLVPALIAAFGYARNDAVDLAADRFNRPDRPVPSGAINVREARFVSWAALGAAAMLLAAVPPGPLGWGIAVLAAGTLFAYSPWLKDRGAAGPLTVAALTVLAVLWGADGGPRAERALLPALLAGAAQFARECVKQLEDAPGDRAAGRTTWGSKKAGIVNQAARLGLVAALLLLPLPATSGGVGGPYLALTFPTAGLLMLWALIALGGRAPRHSRISKAIKAALFSGLAALWWSA